MFYWNSIEYMRIALSWSLICFNCFTLCTQFPDRINQITKQIICTINWEKNGRCFIIIEWKYLRSISNPTYFLVLNFCWFIRLLWLLIQWHISMICMLDDFDSNQFIIKYSSCVPLNSKCLQTEGCRRDYIGLFVFIENYKNKNFGLAIKCRLF